MLKKVAIGFAVIVVLVVAALFAVPAMIDWNGYKPRIAAAVKEATGRDLVIEGDVDVSILPSIAFRAAGVKFANAPGLQPPYMATVARVEGEVAVLPLLGRTVVVKRLLVENPQADLRIDAQGNPNWLFSGPAPGGENGAARESGDGGFGGDVRIENARVVDGRVTFADARTGQTVEAAAIGVDLSVPGLSDPATFDARATVNGDPVNARFALDTPRRLMDGQKAQLQVALDAPKAKAGYAGGIQNRPVPGLDGRFDLDIPSVGTVAAWLGRPLPQGQPDPGPVKAHAVFAADGAKMALTEAVLAGRDLDAKASGSVDLSGPAPRIALSVESGVLNVDRYLPPPAAAPVRAPARASAPPSGPPRDRNPLAALSDEALDLEMLRQGEADIRVRIAGIRAMGFEVGPTDFNATLKDGRLAAILERLQLYGGTVRAKADMDASGRDLALNVDGDVAKVDLGALARAASPGEQPPVAGVASAQLQFDGRGASLRALVESLKGRLQADLGGMNVQNAAAGALSGLKLDVTVPGVDAEPRLTADFVYNREKVSVQAQTAPLPRIMSADRFDVDAAVRSGVLTAGYEGAVVKAPVAGLDGTFTFDAPSAARMAAWLGRPLPQGQADPGPVKARAVFAADGGRIVLREAAVASAGLDASATGSWEQKAGVTYLRLDAKGGVLDLDRYVGPAPQTPPARQGRAPAENPIATLPNDPIDVAPLRSLDADVKLDLAGVRMSGQQLGRVAATARVQNGVATLRLTEIALYGGRLAGTVTADASARALSVNADLKAAGLRAEQFVEASGGPPLFSGTLAADVKGATQGASPRALVQGISGTVGATLSGGSAQYPVSDLDVALDLPGMTKVATLKIGGVYNGEKVSLNGTVGNPQAAISGQRFPASLSLAAAPVSASFGGTVQQAPLPGLDGKVGLDVGSVGRLAAWLGQPLDQPDPGPLKVAATLAADGPRVALRQATIEGKALRATAEGSIDTTSAPRSFKANLVVQQADLDAYLPASAAGRTPAPQPGAPAPATTGWSTDPIDLAMLRDNSGEVDVTLNAIRYRGLTIDKGRMNAVLKGGTLTASLSDMQTAGGRIAGRATLADTGQGAKLSYDASADGLAARPLLTAFAGTDRLAGVASFAAKGTGAGRSQRDIVSSLDGNGTFKFVDGAIYGINIAAALRRAGAAGLDPNVGAEQKTDFAELSGSYVIRKGIVENRDLKMLAPLLRLGGGGVVDLPQQTIDYTVDASLVGTLKGQGGRDDLAGIPVPIRITGPWSAPRWDIQWERMLQNLAKDPERLRNLPDSLKGLAGSSGINLPIPGLGSGSGTGTGGGAGGAAGTILRGLGLPGTGGTRQGGQPAPGPQAAPDQPAPEQAQPPQQQRRTPEGDAQQLLRGLFGR